MLNQRLQQKLLQKLSPQQIQLMKLLQLPSLALEQRIKHEIEENPALEEGSENEDLSADEMDNTTSLDEENSKEEEQFDEEFSISDYMDDDEIPSYKTSTNNTSDDEETKDIPFSLKKTFHENLTDQLGLRDLDEKQYQIALHIIGNIDDSGYIKRPIDAIVDDLALSQNINTNKKELEEALAMIQEFDPAGVGARSLQECLLLQLQRKDYESKAIKNAEKILKRSFSDFTKKHYEKIIKKLELTEDELKEAIQEIITLNPKPGNSLGDSGKTSEYVIPDFIVSNNNGELELTLNSKNAPELKVNKTYSNMLKAYAENKDKNNKKQKEAVMFVKQKLDSAKWFIDAIKQRQHTLISTMEAIMEYQKEYFLEGDETKLRPMILKDIAEKVNLDISTISRVVNSKYVQTPFGTFLLKTFFSESMEKENGEIVSTREIKKILKDYIETEDKKKPVTDEALSKILKEKGYNIARRTVAKYREQLGIPVARLRKEL